MNNIVLIDDDLDLCDLLSEFLRSEGFNIRCFQDGHTGLSYCTEKNPDLAVIDVMLPGINGFEVLKNIRKTGSLPVIMLTARGEEIDRILGLEMGADDYLSKPFNPRELAARIRAVLRRLNQDSEENSRLIRKLAVDDIEMDFGNRTVTCASQNIEFTSAEFNLLELLLRNAGALVSRDELIQKVLGRLPSPFDRSIDVHVSKLRKKLGPSSSGTERIKSIRGAGYLFILEDKITLQES